jgi:hypothetical protein
MTKLNRWRMGCVAFALLFMGMVAEGQTFTVLYSFHGEVDGANPAAPPIVDNLGNLYGTTTQAGDLSCLGSLGCGNDSR